MLPSTRNTVSYLCALFLEYYSRVISALFSLLVLSCHSLIFFFFLVSKNGQVTFLNLLISRMFFAGRYLVEAGNGCIVPG